jgi:hypothetical protein
MKTVHNGTVAVTLEYERATVRAINHVPEANRPPYVGIGQITRLPGGVALLSGFCGAIGHAHCWLMLMLLLEDGFKVVIMERGDGHIAPFGEQITTGDFAGLWRIDLSQVRERRKRPVTQGAPA